jgi:hypothetical protein
MPESRPLQTRPINLTAVSFVCMFRHLYFLKCCKVNKSSYFFIFADFYRDRQLQRRLLWRDQAVHQRQALRAYAARLPW